MYIRKPYPNELYHHGIQGQRWGVRRCQNPDGSLYLRTAYPNELYHHGIKGQRWGIRRFQNPDGTLTAAGRKRYLDVDGTFTKKGEKFAKKSEAHRELLNTAAKSNPISEMEKMGFDTDGGMDKNGDVSFYKDKRLKTGDRSEVYITTNLKDKRPITPEESQKAMIKVDEHAAKVKVFAAKELKRQIEDGQWGDGPDSKLKIGNIETVWVERNKKGKLTADYYVEIRNNRNEGFEEFSFKVDLDSGKFLSK